MSVLPAQSIRQLRPVLPFRERCKVGTLSGGLSAAGYDIHIAENLWMWPLRYVLASSLEHFDMPDDLVAVVHDKSTWARRGITVQNTVIEPGWHGYLTLELRMNKFRIIRLRAGMPIAQILFHRLEQATDLPYEGKYQGQAAGPQKAR